MTSWTSPPYKLTAKILSRSRWLVFRIGPPFLRFYTTLLTVTHYASLTIGAACVILLLTTTSGMSLSEIGWGYIGGIVGISTLRVRLRRRGKMAVTPVFMEVVRTITIDEWGVTQTFDDDQARLTWSNVEQILKSRHGIYLSLDPSRYYVVPAQCFNSPGEMDTVYKQAIAFHQAAKEVDQGYPSAWPNLYPDRSPDIVYELPRSSVWSVTKKTAKAHAISVAVWLFIAVAVACIASSDAGHSTLRFVADVALSIFTATFAMSSGHMLWYRAALVAWACGPRWEVWLGPAGMILRSRNEQSSSPWSLVSRIDHAGDCICFQHDSGIVRAIPLTAWSRPVDADSFFATAVNYRENDVLDRAGGPQSADVWPPPPNRKSSA